MNAPLPQVPAPTRHTKRRVKTPLPDRADAVVVGSGLGGLLCAAALARRGQRVVVLDQHYVAGGCATMFQRGRADARWRFDVGVHYLGDSRPGGRVEALYRAVGAELDLLPLDEEGFDRFHLPSLTVRMPTRLEAWRDVLVDLFPREVRGIDRYVDLVRQVSHVSQHAMANEGRTTPGFVWQVLRRGRSVLRWQHATMEEVLDHCTEEPLLRALMCAQTGDVGVPPSRASAMAYLGLTSHFFRGGAYPRGGGQQLADALAEAVEAQGGAIRLRTEVSRILVERGQVAGVRTADGHVLRAPVVISNADTRRTLLELLPPDVLPRSVRQRARDWEMSHAITLVCLGVAGDLTDHGMYRGNEWIFDSDDPEDVYADAAEGRLLPHALLVTSASLKDDAGGHAPPGHQTLELMSFLPGDPAAWGVHEQGVAPGTYRDDPAYRARKEEVTDRMVDLLGRVFPRVPDQVVFRETATPVSHGRYTRASGGTAYGLAATVDQFLDRRPGPVGPVPGLFLCGASTRSAHGLIGSLNGGWIAAGHALDALGAPRLPLDWRP